MIVSQKTQYALQSMVELGASHGDGLRSIGSIAASQQLPVRFLEAIFSELKSGGFVESRRGSRGGYRLARSPEWLTVGEVIRFLAGPIGPVAQDSTPSATDPRDPLGPMWRRVHDALSEIYDSTTIADLVEERKRAAAHYVPEFVI